MAKEKNISKVTDNTTNKKENKTMAKETTAITTATDNNAINVTTALDNALSSLGYVALHTDDYKFKVEKDIDGEKALVDVSTNDNVERKGIDELHIIRNVTTYSLPKQCAILAMIADKGTYKEKGVTFKAYAYSIVNGQIAEPTIQKYANVGKCFLKAIENEYSPLEWVDERLATMNGGHGVSITNLDAILATFKAYADKTEIDGADNYRDYVSSFLDEFCIDHDGIKARLHLEATLPTLREEIKKLNGKDTAKKTKDKDKDKEKDNKPDNTLNPFDGLVNALTRYRDSDNPNKDILTKVNELLSIVETMPETSEK